MLPGKVEYVASFYLVKPIDMSKSSRLMWQDVPNRGGRITISAAHRNDGDIGLSSGWQGDNSGRTVPADDNDRVTVPIAKNANGSPVTGLVIGRIVNASGADSRPVIVNANPVPYKPTTLDTTKATLTTHRAETQGGVVTEGPAIPSGDWAWAKCSATNPFPGTPDSTQICVKGGFDPKLLYQVVFTSQDAYVLGIGFAAFRHPRRLDRQLIRSLSACDWVRHHQNVIVTGPCGVGKSFIAGVGSESGPRGIHLALRPRSPSVSRSGRRSR